MVEMPLRIQSNDFYIVHGQSSLPGLEKTEPRLKGGCFNIAPT